MTLPVLILRPIDGARATAARAKQLSLEPLIDPLFEIEPLDWNAPPSPGFDALMLTSANAIKFGGAGIARYEKLPVLAVGEATASAARKAGFSIQETGRGGAQALLDSLKNGQYPKILRLAGKPHVTLKAADRQITVREVYQSLALPLGKKAKGTLVNETAVLLHSPRAAKKLTDNMQQAGLDRSNCHIIAISEQTALAAGDGWKSMNWAEQPDDDTLLSLAARLCL